MPAVPKRKPRIRARRREGTALARLSESTLDPVVRAAAGAAEAASRPVASGPGAALGGAPHGMPPRKGAQTVNGPPGTVAQFYLRNGKLPVRFLFSFEWGARVVSLFQ